MDKFKMFLWGILSLHTLLLWIFPVFYLLPDTGWANFLSFFGIVLAFSINLFLSYLLGVFWIKNFEDLVAFSLITFGLGGFIFAPLAISNYCYYLDYKHKPTLPATPEKMQKLQAIPLYSIGQARILGDLAAEKAMRHSYKSSKSGQTTSYNVCYKVAPLVSLTWQKSDTISTWLVYHGKERLIKDFDLKYLAKTLPQGQTEYHNALNLSKECTSKHRLHIASSPTLLVLIDLEDVLQDAWGYARFFYAMLMSIWIVSCIFLIFSTKTVVA